MVEPELITIVEGPTPEFRPSPQVLFQSIYEGPVDNAVAVCEMRTHNGEDIRQRCLRAWREGRPVKLDFPDDMRLRQRVDVVAMRLSQLDEAMMLTLWVNWPVEDDEEDEDDYDDFDEFDEEEYDEGEFDDSDDDFSY